MGMVFQNFELFPHLTVLRNITIGPTTVLKLDAAAAEKRAHALLAKVGLAEKADKSILPRSPAASSSAWRSPARSRWSRR